MAGVNAALIEWLPLALKEAEQTAAPELTAMLEQFDKVCDVVVSVKETVPAAVEGDTVAVSVTLVPTVVEELEEVTLVDVEVGLVEELLEPLPEPQPATQIAVKSNHPKAVAYCTYWPFIS